MAFRIDELLWLLKASEPPFSDDDIARMARKSVRSIGDYKNGKAQPKPKQVGEMQDKLSPALVKACNLPWSLSAHYHVNSIRNLDRDRAFEDLERIHGFSAQQFIRQLSEIDPDDIQSGRISASPEMWGMAIIAYFYLRSVWMNAEEQKQSDLSANWNRIIQLLMSMVSKENDSPWAKILSFKIASGKFAVIWNSLDPKTDERSSSEIRKKVDDLDIYNTFIAYNDIVPTAKEAPWSATCIASRFKERDKYPDLYSRLSKADPSFLTAGGILELKEIDRDLDEDFEDFLKWVSENQETLFRKGAA